MPNPRGIHVQENLSTKQPPPPEGAWIPRADEDREGAPRAQAPPRQRPEKIDSIDELRPGERLTRDDRLHHRREFDAIYSRGIRIPGRYFILFLLPNTLGRSRLGVTLSRKIGGAVVRNLARRRLREIFRKHRALLTGGLDIVVHARTEIAGQSLDVLRRQFIDGIARFDARQGIRQ
jgi:ribonuclease P protein component